MVTHLSACAVICIEGRLTKGEIKYANSLTAFNVGSLPPEIIDSHRAHIDEYIRQRTTNLQKGTA
jgi:hypothetical protein